MNDIRLDTGAIGDRALILKLDGDLVRDCHGVCDDTASHGLLLADATMLRNLLWMRFGRAEANEFQAEAHGLDLVDISLKVDACWQPVRSAIHASSLAARPCAREGSRNAGASRQVEGRKAGEYREHSLFHPCHIYPAFPKVFWLHSPTALRRTADSAVRSDV